MVTNFKTFFSSHNKSVRNEYLTFIEHNFEETGGNKNACHEILTTISDENVYLIHT